MYSALGFNQSPFRNCIDCRWFHESHPHEEALARLLYLVENGHRFGLLRGASGTGKSMLLEVLRAQVERARLDVAFVDLLGTNEHELLWKLCDEFQLARVDNDPSWALWRAVDDHMQSLRLTQQPLLLVFDHLESAVSDCILTLHRLLHLGSDSTSIIVGVRTGELPRSAKVLSDLSDLRIDIPALNCEETHWYVTDLVQRAGSELELFDRTALDVVYDHSLGEPRSINRICELAIVAALAENRNQIDGELVATVAAELQQNPHAVERIAAV